MFVRLLCGENSTRQVAGLKSGRLKSGLKAGKRVCRGGASPLCTPPGRPLSRSPSTPPRRATRTRVSHSL